MWEAGNFGKKIQLRAKILGTIQTATEGAGQMLSSEKHASHSTAKSGVTAEVFVQPAGASYWLHICL